MKKHLIATFIAYHALAGNFILDGLNYLKQTALISSERRDLNSCYSRALKSLTIPRPKLNPIFFSDIKKGEMLGEGALHYAYRINRNGENLVYLDYGISSVGRSPNSLAFPNAAIAFRNLTKSEKEQLLSLHSLDDAEKLRFIKEGRRLFKDLPKEDPKNELAIIYLRELVDISYMDRLSSIEYKGERIFPQIRNLVFDDSGALRGYIMNEIKGIPLGDILRSRVLNQKELRKLKKELLNQLDLIHGKKLIHGDLEYHLDNVLVEVDANGNIQKLRMIDFNIALGLERSYTPKKEREFIDLHFQDAGLE